MSIDLSPSALQNVLQNEMQTQFTLHTRTHTFSLHLLLSIYSNRLLDMEVLKVEGQPTVFFLQHTPIFTPDLYSASTFALP